jgi:hypothetical protein
MAAWIARERKRLELKPVDLAARLQGLGLEASAQTVRVWESYAGRNPSPDNIDGLEQIFGTEAPGADEGNDTAALVAAIQAQTTAINALVGRLDVLTEGQATAAGEMMRALGILGGRLGPQGTPREGEPEAHGGTGR